MLGAGVAVVIVRMTEARVWAFRSSLILETLLLIAFLVLGVYYGPFTDGDQPIALIAGLSTAAAMGVQSALVRLVMRDVPQTNVMTGNSTQIAIDIADLVLGRAGVVATGPDIRAAQFKRMRIIGGMLVAFMLGAGAGAFGYRWFNLQAMAAPIAVMIGMIGWLMLRNFRR